MTEIDAGVVRELLDREQIRQLVADYSYFIDHGAFADVVALFTETCSVSYGPGMGPTLSGRSELAGFLDAAAKGTDSGGFVNTSHHNADVRLAFQSPDRASGTVSLYAWHGAADGTAAELWGYYYDRYERTAMGWKFAERVLKVCGEENFALEWSRVERAQPPK